MSILCRDRSVTGMILTGDTEVPGAKSVTVSPFPPKIPQELARERTRASAFGGSEFCKSEITSKLPVMQWEDHSDATVSPECST
jgi:hypothetical protein